MRMTFHSVTKTLDADKLMFSTIHTWSTGISGFFVFICRFLFFLGFRTRVCSALFRLVFVSRCLPRLPRFFILSRLLFIWNKSSEIMFSIQKLHSFMWLLKSFLHTIIAVFGIRWIVSFSIPFRLFTSFSRFLRRDYFSSFLRASLLLFCCGFETWLGNFFVLLQRKYFCCGNSDFTHFGWCNCLVIPANLIFIIL